MFILNNVYTTAFKIKLLPQSVENRKCISFLLHSKDLMQLL